MMTAATASVVTILSHLTWSLLVGVKADVLIPTCPNANAVAIHEFRAPGDFQHFTATYWTATTPHTAIGANELTSTGVQLVTSSPGELTRTGAMWDKAPFTDMGPDFQITVTARMPLDANFTGLSINIIDDSSVVVCHSITSGWDHYGIGDLKSFTGLQVFISAKKDAAESVTIYYSGKGTGNNGFVKNTLLENHDTFSLRNSSGIKYQFNIIGGCRFSMEACVVGTDQCLLIADNVTLPLPLPDLLHTKSMRLGVGAWVESAETSPIQSVEINEIRVNNCSASTQPCNSNSTTTTTSPPTSPALTTTAKAPGACLITATPASPTSTTTTVATSPTTAATTTTVTVTSPKPVVSSSTTAKAATTTTVTTPKPVLVSSSTTATTNTTKPVVSSSSPAGTTTTAKRPTSASTSKAEIVSNRPGPKLAAPSSGESDEEAAVGKVTALEESPNQKVQQKSFTKTDMPMTEQSDKEFKTVKDIQKTCSDFSPRRTAPETKQPPFKVKPEFAVDTFQSISTVDQTITVSAMFLLSWSVSTCPIDNSTMRLRSEPESIFVDSFGDIWTPAYRFLQSSTSNIYMKQNDAFGQDIIASVSGDVDRSPNMTVEFYWLKDGQYSAACSLDLAQFTFDKQTCLFSFSLMRSLTMIEFDENPKFSWPEKQDDEWHYLGQSTLQNQLFYKGLPTSSVHFSVTLKRNPTYYIVNVILPILLVVLVALGSYALPPHDATRPSLVVYCLLALTVSQSAINNFIPKTSGRVLLADYVSCLAWLTAACFLYQIVICWYAAKQHQQRNAGNSQCLATARIADLFCFVALLGGIIGLHIYAFRVISH